MTKTGPVLGLTGGIASGKSTVAGLLRRRGAIVIDADAIARQLVEPGMPALQEIALRFGQEYLRPDGSLDRSKLGRLVFSDGRARQRLNDLLHPRIFAEIRKRIAESDPSRVRIVEAALLVESAPWNTGELDMDGLIVVSSPRSAQVERAVGRGMSEHDAERRIAAQIEPGERLGAADFVINNRGSVEELEAEVERVWSEVAERFGTG